MAGYDVVREPGQVRSVIGLAGQFAAVDETLTGRENLVLVGRLYHLGKAEAARRAAEVLERFDLVAAADRRVGTYSGGMRRRLDLGASLVGRPQVLFLDEPTSGLDPRSRIGLWEIIAELVAAGTTLLLTTQYLEEADRLADTIAVIDNGRVIAQGTPDDLKARVGRRGGGGGGHARVRRPGPRSPLCPPSPPARPTSTPRRDGCRCRSPPAGRWWPTPSASSTRPASASPTCPSAARPSTTSSSPSPATPADGVEPIRPAEATAGP